MQKGRFLFLWNVSVCASVIYVLCVFTFYFILQGQQNVVDSGWDSVLNLPIKKNNNNNSSILEYVVKSTLLIYFQVRE